MTELFSAILKASFQGSIVILAVVLLRFLLKQAPKSLFCLLWLLAGLRLVMLFEIPSPLSLQPRLEDTNISIQAQQPVHVPDITIQNPEGQPLETPADPVLPPEVPEGNWENLQTDSYPYWVEDGVITGPVDFGNIAAWVWLLGAAGMLIASLVSYWKLKRRVREGYLIENGCFECPGLDTAFVLGFLPPRIYLPMGLSDQEKKFVFDHENTHIARNDHWFKVLGYVILSIHWFNPLVWLGYSLLCRDMELACDEQVVKHMTLPERKAYSAALLSCGGRTARIAACPVAFGESNPKKRILNVLNYKRPSFWIVLLTVIAVIFVAACLLTSPSTEEDLSFLNYENAVSLVAEEDVVFTIYCDENSIIPCQVDGGELAVYLDLANWKERIFEPNDQSSPGSVEFVITEDYRIQVYDRNFAKVRYGEDVRYYRIGRQDYEAATQLLKSPENVPETTEPDSILSEKPIWDEDMMEEEYLAICRDALAELQSREHFHISETLAYFTGETEDSRNYVVFWQDGENWLRESYVTRMRTNSDFLYYDGVLYIRKQEEGSEAAWNRIDGGGEGYGNLWLRLISWDDQKVTFVGTALEGEEFRIALAFQGTPPTLGFDDIGEYKVLFCFDKNWNLTRAILSADREDLRIISDLIVENTLLSNIRKKLDNVAAQRPDAPELHQSLTEEQWLEKCRAALESYQAQGTWAIQSDIARTDSMMQNSHSSQLWYIDGEDWVKHGISSESDSIHEIWDMRKDNIPYGREIHQNHHPENGGGYDSGWMDHYRNENASLPWPLEFDWQSADILSTEARTDGADAMVFLYIAGSPYPDVATADNEYLVILYLTPSGDLSQVKLEYTSVGSDGGKTRVKTTLFPYAAAPEEAQRMIAQCHSEAMLHIHGICNDPTCTDSAHDHSGINCTDKNCTNSTHHHSDEHHDDKHHH